jgi:branched-chain amino acid transport system ATP-binding protein
MLDIPAAPASAAPVGTGEPLVLVQDLHAFYGESHILHGVSLNVNAGEVVTLLGRNGAGKTTTLRCIMGMVRQRRGSIRVHGEETIGWPSNRIARKGVAFVPEERGIFSSLTVEENLLLPPIIAEGGLSVDELYTLFPNLKERRGTRQGTRLSGGEQQMLAIARILRTGARVLLLDEPTEGLAPVIVQQIERVIGELRARGFTILLVEQNFRFASRIADRNYVMEDGRIVGMVPHDEVEARADFLQDYLGV